jgi:hypothetical protein
MLLSHFVEHFKNDANIGNSIALYCIASVNLSSQFQRQNYCRCGVAGSREQANIDRSVTPSGAPSKASSLMSRAAMYLANNIQDMKLIACLILPPSLVNRGADGPILTRILEKRKEGDLRPDYALKGKTMAVALESIYHAELDDMPNVSRGRTSRQEWFKTTQSNFQNVKLSLQAVGQGVFYDFTKFSPTAKPSDFIGKGTRLEGGRTLETTTHTFRESPRLQELRRAVQAGDEVEGEDGIIRLDASDVDDIRKGTPRGMQLLDLITQKEKAAATTQTAQTATAAAQTTTPPPAPPPQRTTATQAPLNVRMTRSAIRALRTTETTEDERRRRRIARALAELTI